MEIFLLGAAGHKRMSPESKNEHGVFIFLGNLSPSTSESGKAQIIEELSNVVGRPTVGFRGGTVFLTGSGFNETEASRMARNTGMQVIFGKGATTIGSISDTDAYVEKADGLFVASPDGGVRKTKVPKVILPQAKQGMNQAVAHAPSGAVGPQVAG